jgi:cyclic-di-AMP phosphodiesterase PgpH
MSGKEKSNVKSNKTGFKIKLYPLLPILLWIIITVGTMLLFPFQGASRFNELALGSISKDEIIAPFTFEIIKSEDDLARQRDEARSAVNPVYYQEDSVLVMQVESLTNVLHSVDMARDLLRPYARRRDPLMDERSRELFIETRDTYNPALTEESWRFLLGNVRSRFDSEENPITKDLLESVLREILGRGILDRIPEDVASTGSEIWVVISGEERASSLTDFYSLQVAREVALSHLTNEFEEEFLSNDDAIRVGYELLVAFILPNIIYDASETESRRDGAVAKVPIVEGIVLENERIIDSNQRITDRHLKLLRSLDAKRAELADESGGWSKYLPWIGRFSLAGLIYFFFGFWIKRFRDDIYSKPNKLLLFWIITASMIAVYGLIFMRYEINQFLFPAALGAMILVIVFDANIALLYSFLLSLIIGNLTGNDLFTVLWVFMPSAVSVFAVLRVRTRVQVMSATPLVFSVYAIIIVVRRILTYQLDMTIFNDLLYAAANSLAIPLLALGLLIVIELVFRVTSDFTLLELADLNRPLLKRLSLEAPGTYHHSIMVGNLAEAAAEAIQANPLLVRAGAYYHDIGKMVRREYFVENQIGQANVHDSMSPEDSAKMLSDHVIQGIEIAEKHHLPEAIKAFILEHHGTSLMLFFYNKAMESMPEGSVDESIFRYPGPKPQSKETGILMLADSAEAATRSIDDPSPDNIRNVVREVIINKYSDREMDESPLTLHDLRQIMEAFVPILQGIHHHRINYPTREDIEKNQSRAQKNAETKKEQKNESIL